MPQLEISTYLPQLFWLGIFFIILYIGMARWIVPLISSILESRSTKLYLMMKEAEHLKKQADALRVYMDEALQQSQQQARHVMSSTIQELKQAHKMEEQHLHQELSQRIYAAERKLEETQKEALFRAKKSIYELSQQMCLKLTGQNPDKQTLETMIEEAMRDDLRK